ncbi:hypothetical protein ECZU27_14420 [Escherichia coli]|nr:hypothetical protein ECZU27_14420 [Escherichia coli]
MKVSEPNAAEATIILRGLSAVYEQSHGVLIDDDALQAAATLSERYLSGRQLPDKAIDVLDTACARVAINLSSPPKQISALTTLSHQQEAEIRQLERELRIGLRTDTSRMTEVLVQYDETLTALDELEAAAPAADAGPGDYRAAPAVTGRGRGRCGAVAGRRYRGGYAARVRVRTG